MKYNKAMYYAVRQGITEVSFLRLAKKMIGDKIWKELSLGRL